MDKKWSKYILGVGSRRTNITVSAELGRYPLIIEIMCTVIKYWFRMSDAKITASFMFVISQMCKVLKIKIIVRYQPL